MIEDGIYDRLQNYAGLTSLISTRVYVSHLPQTPTFPCVAFRKVSSAPMPLLSSDTNVYESVFEIASFDKTYDDSNNVLLQVLAAVQRYSGTNNTVVIMDINIDNINNDYQDDLEIYESTITATVTHREA